MLQISPSDFTPRFAFSPGDTLSINGFTWRVHERRKDSVVVDPKEEGGIVSQFTDTQLAQVAQQGLLSHEPVAKPSADVGADQAGFAEVLCSLHGQKRRKLELRRAVVLAFVGLYEEGSIKRTDPSINANKERIQSLAGQILKQKDEEFIAWPKFSPRTLRRWLDSYESFGPSGLLYSAVGGGNTQPRLAPEVSRVLNTCVQGYLSTQKPTIENIFQDLGNAIAKLNEQRRSAGLHEFKKPSRETLRKAIRALDPLEVCLAREGEEIARKKFAPTRNGVKTLRPLQRVEIDEWRADLITLLSEADFLKTMSAEEREQLGLNKKSLRVLITVAVCVATRCIVGLCISPEGSTDSALQTIEIIRRDKGVFSDAVGALSSWHMCGTPELIVTDCAKYNISSATRHAVVSIGSRIEHCPAAHPEMKSVIERLFGTMSTSLLPRFTGRTFYNVVAKGDRDPTSEAALTVNDLCIALTRWIVDINHLKQHRGLGGETPFDCWNRLIAKYGVRPAPSKQIRVLAFGNQITRKLQKTGITVLGIHYQRNALAEHLLHGNARDLRVRWHPDDLGSIFVEIDSKWHEAKDVSGLFNGVSALQWNLTRKATRARNARAEKLHADVVRKALEDIKRTNEDALRRAGLQVQKWTEEEVAAIEVELFIGFDIVDGSTNHEPATAPWGEELATGLSHPGDGAISDLATDAAVDPCEPVPEGPSPSLPRNSSQVRRRGRTAPNLTDSSECFFRGEVT